MGRGEAPLPRNSMEIKGNEEGEEEKSRERRRRIDGWKEKGDKPQTRIMDLSLGVI